MRTSEQINELATALAKAQKAIRPARMTAKNPFLKNRYATLADITDAIRRPLSDNGLSYVQMPTTVDGAIGLTTRLMHQSGEWIEDTYIMPMGESKGMSPMQTCGSAISYARRYALSAMVGIVADEDDDGNAPQAQASPNGEITLKDDPARRRGFHALGREVYADEWDAKRKVLCAHFGRESSNDLLMSEVQVLEDGMREKRVENGNQELFG